MKTFIRTDSSTRSMLEAGAIIWISLAAGIAGATLARTVLVLLGFAEPTATIVGFVFLCAILVVTEVAGKVRLRFPKVHPPRPEVGAEPSNAETAKSLQVPDSAFSVGPAVHSSSDAKHRKLLLLLVGTYGMRMGQRILNDLISAGHEEDLAAIAVIEADAAHRSAFLAHLPMKLRLHTIVASFSPFAAGLFGKHEMHPGFSDWWNVEVAKAIEAASSLAQARMYTDASGELAKSPVVLAFASSGGHSALGISAVHLLQSKLPDASTYVVTALPADAHARAHFFSTIQEFDELAIQGMLLVDSARVSASADEAVSRLLASLWLTPSTAGGVEASSGQLDQLDRLGASRVAFTYSWHQALSRPPKESQLELSASESEVVQVVFDGIDTTLQYAEQIEKHERRDRSVDRYLILSVPVHREALNYVKAQIDRYVELMSSRFSAGRDHFIWVPIAGKGKRAAIETSIVMVGIQTGSDEEIGTPGDMPEAVRDETNTKRGPSDS